MCAANAVNTHHHEQINRIEFRKSGIIFGLAGLHEAWDQHDNKTTGKRDAQENTARGEESVEEAAAKAVNEQQQMPNVKACAEARGRGSARVWTGKVRLAGAYGLGAREPHLPGGR